MGEKIGEIKVKSFDKPEEDLPIIEAFESNIACIALNTEGTLLAVSSDEGTLVKVYKTDDCTLLQELRRGSDSAEIYSLSFNPDSSFLACSSDKGTIHIFALNDPKKGDKDDVDRPKNQTSL